MRGRIGADFATKCRLDLRRIRWSALTVRWPTAPWLTDEDKLSLPLFLQPGRGALGALLRVEFVYTAPSWTVAAQGQARASLMGRHQWQQGTQASVSLVGLAHVGAVRIGANTELRGGTQDTLYGAAVASTGGGMWALGPAVQWLVSTEFLLSAHVSVPIAQWDRAGAAEWLTAGISLYVSPSAPSPVREPPRRMIATHVARNPAM
ncbi:MAG: transporter [Deltaproteobacteria bacterium]|nr:transporter [Deltaproteobacteria bacterium]